jgi:hypothetical protein
VRVINVYDGTEKKTADKAQQEIINNLQSSWGQYEYNLLINDAMQAAEIKVEKTQEDSDNV